MTHIAPQHITDTQQCAESLPGVPLALYLHIPFCSTRCTYCAFNTYTTLSNRITDYMAALTAEIQAVGSASQHVADTIYFGCGTPSLVAANQIERVLQQCFVSFRMEPTAEITLEVNPGDGDVAYFQVLRSAGINRLSIGMQSAHDSELRLFARRHSVETVTDTVALARQAGFDNVSLDLIYGNPEQSFAMWQQSLRAALELSPDHISLYSLGIEDGTPMQRWIEEGHIAQPDSDLAADMYEWACDHLATAGFEQYEISNWALPGRASRHNLHYWRNHPYLGFGAGAHGYANYTRYVTVTRPEVYIQRMQTNPDSCEFPLSPAVDVIEQGDACQSMSDMMIMGLRLTQEGILLADFQQRFGVPLRDVYGTELDRLIKQGLLESTPDARVRLTPRGKLLGNLVFAEFV